MAFDTNVLHIAADSLFRNPELVESILSSNESENSTTHEALVYGRIPSRAKEEDMQKLNEMLRKSINDSINAEHLSAGEPAKIDIFSQPHDLILLDGMCRWLFRQADGRQRQYYWMISLVFSPIIYATREARDFGMYSQVTLDVNDILGSFLKETPRYMASMIRYALVTQPMEAKLPVQKSAHFYDEVSALSTPELQMAADGAASEEIMRLIQSVNPTMVVTVKLDGPEARETALKRLLQTVQAIAGYRAPHTACSLRLFLNSVSSLLMHKRMISGHRDEFAGDLQMFIVSMEKQAQCFSYSAATLVQRAQAGQLVYAEMLNLCNQWHSLMNSELTLVLHAFAYFAREMVAYAKAGIKNGTDVQGWEEFMNMLTTALTRSESLRSYVTYKTRTRS